MGKSLLPVRARGLHAGFVEISITYLYSQLQRAFRPSFEGPERTHWSILFDGPGLRRRGPPTTLTNLKR